MGPHCCSVLHVMNFHALLVVSCILLYAMNQAEVPSWSEAVVLRTLETRSSRRIETDGGCGKHYCNSCQLRVGTYGTGQKKAASLHRRYPTTTTPSFYWSRPLALQTPCPTCWSLLKSLNFDVFVSSYSSIAVIDFLLQESSRFMMLCDKQLWNLYSHSAITPTPII